MEARVLVIERSAAVALMLCGLLRRWGVEAVHEAPEGASAPGDFNLVIADPAERSERLAALRAAGVPWLALMPAGQAAAGDADGWVVKPVRAEDLRAAVEACLKQGGDGIDEGVVAALWDGVDDPKFRMVAEAFLGEMAERLAAIAAALAAEDRGRVLIEAHSVASAAANVGGMAMSRTARELENLAQSAPFAQLRSLGERLRALCGRDLPALRRLTGLGDTP